MSRKEHIDINIELCSKCGGRGDIEHSELEDYHKNEYRYWHTICKQCFGTGKVKRTVTTITEIESYDNPRIADLTLENLKT